MELANGTRPVSFYDVISGEWQANESVVADVQVRNINNATSAYLTARCNQHLSYFICSYPNTTGCADRNPPAMLYYETTCYSIHNTQKVTWWQARNLCVSYGGDLGIVFNKDFNYLIDPHQLTPNTTYWVGLYREQWIWSVAKGQGEPFEMKYSNWAPLAPKDGSYHCMCLSGGETGDQTTSGPVLSSSSEITTAAPQAPWQWVDCDCKQKYQVVGQRMVRIGLGFGLGLGLFVLLLITLTGVYLIIDRRNKSKNSDTVIENIKHFIGLGSTPGRSSKDLARERTLEDRNTDDALGRNGSRPELPLGYEKLQKVRTSTSPTFIIEDDSHSGYYEEIPDSPTISAVIENPTDSGISTSNTLRHSTETSNTNSSDGGYSSAETSGDSAGLRNVENSVERTVDSSTAENLNTSAISTEQFLEAVNCHDTENPGSGESPNYAENSLYHRYYNRSVIPSRDSYLNPITPLEMPLSFKSGEYLHPLKAHGKDKQLEDDGSKHKSPSVDYLEVLPDIS